MINGYTSINITKLDVLDELEEIKVGVGYKLNGASISTFPANLEDVANLEVEYETFKGWTTDTTKCSSWNDLPANAKNYLARISALLKVPITWVGTGPKRENMIANPQFH